MKGLEIKEVKRCEENFELVENRVTYHICVEGVKVGEAVVIEPLTEDQAEELEIPYSERDTYTGWTHCDSLVVDKEYQNRGIGTAALEKLTDIYESFTITPTCEDNKRLYERLGTEDLTYQDACYTDQGYGVFEIC